MEKRTSQKTGGYFYETQKSSGTDKKVSEDKTITFWSVFTGGDGTAMQKIIDAYNATNPAYKVEHIMVEQNDLYTKLPLVISSQEGVPDLVIQHVDRLASNARSNMYLSMIDGANRFQIYYKLILPLCVPVLIVVGMFAFTGAWNDYLWPSIVMNKIDMLTITPGMQKIKDSFNTMPAHAIAGGFISVIPTFIVYLFAQKHFMKGMQMQAGVKG